MRLVACPSCSQHVRAEDPACPHCGASVRTTTGWRPPAVLLGLALTGCPADDYRDDLPAESSSTTAPSTASATTVGTSSEGSSSTTMDMTSVGSEPAYGVPQTESDTSPGTESGSSTGVDSTGTTDGSTTGGSDTSTGSEPLYGALDSA